MEDPNWLHGGLYDRQGPKDDPGLPRRLGDILLSLAIIHHRREGDFEVKNRLLQPCRSNCGQADEGLNLVSMRRSLQTRPR